jgi:uncharacterized protein (TIGR03435 family)
MRACLIIFLLVMAAGLIFGQSAPSFDVTSIKLSPPWQAGMTGGVSLDGTRFSSSRNPLRGLIFSAYGVPYWRLSGGPAWLETDAYDIMGTFPPNTSQDQVKLMLQTLFADRFKLAIHRETKDYPVYALVVGKDGPKLKAAVDGKYSAKNAGGHLELHHANVAGFATYLVNVADRPVVDMTGLDGYFDISLDWRPETPQPGNDPRPSIYTAVQEQLGLKLEPRKAPVEFIVIDHIERPSEN